MLETDTIIILSNLYHFHEACDFTSVDDSENTFF